MDEIAIFNNEKKYELPARVVSVTFKGIKFIRLFLSSAVEITSYIATDRTKNILLKNNRSDDFQLLQQGDYILVECKGILANEYLTNGEIKDREEKVSYFIEKIHKEKYDEMVHRIKVEELTELFDLSKEMRNKEADKSTLTEKINQLDKQLNEKSVDFEKLVENIRILKELQNLEEAKNFLEVQINLLEIIRAENQWLEKVKPYFQKTTKVADFSEDKFSQHPYEIYKNIEKALIGRFNLSIDFINCYLLSTFASLIQGRFLLLTGHIGTGKSKIIKETGKLIGGRTNLIAVRPAWLDASDLLGYFDPINSRYNSTDFVKYLTDNDKPNHINMILLDELNIARIENYGADILANLSPIGEWEKNERHLEEHKIRLFPQNLQEYIYVQKMYYDLVKDEETKKHYKPIVEQILQESAIAIPNNVLICGTLNIDGSTENLSPKMIDRSFILKFPDFDGQLVQSSEIIDNFPMPIQYFITELASQQEIDVQIWNHFYTQYIQDIKELFLPLSNRVAKDYLIFFKLANFFEITDKNIDAYFFYARILPRLSINQFSKTIKSQLTTRLNEFNSVLFQSFINELNETQNGHFVDYQHICG